MIRQITATVIANIIAVSYGVAQGWSSPSIPILRANATSLGSGAITPEQESWLGSLLFLGAFMSSPVFSYVNHNWGRKMAGYLSVAPLVVSWTIVIFADDITYLYVARLVMGFSLSGINVFITLYIGEISEDGVRGFLGNVRSLTADVGIIIIYVTGPYLSIRNMAIISAVTPVLFIFGYFWLPESPMYLLSKGKNQEALESFLWLRGGDRKLAEEEMLKLSTVVALETMETHMKDLLAVRGTRRALAIALVLATVQQMSGMNVVFSYCASIFEASGSNLSPYTSSLVFSVVNLLGSVCACFSSDTAGRRVVLISTQVFQGMCLGVLGVYLYLRHAGVDVSAAGLVPVICISLYCFCVVAGPASMFYVVLSETFRPEARGVATSVTSSFLWMLAFLSTKFYSFLVDLLGDYGCFWLFALVSFGGAVFIYFQLPETKNKSLENILKELNGDDAVKSPDR